MVSLLLRRLDNFFVGDNPLLNAGYRYCGFSIEVVSDEPLFSMLTIRDAISIDHLVEHMS